MDPRHLIQLAVILDKGSITAAATHLRMTQPTLTRNVSTLEMQAGQPLFSRSRFGVRSTPMGEDLARQGRAIARQMELCEVVTSRHKIGLHAHLRIATGPLIGMALIHRIVESVVSERHRHRYEFNSQYRTRFEASGFVCSGTSPDRRLVEFVELKDHPFWVGTQAHPEFKSRPDRPHPLFRELIAASLVNREKRLSGVAARTA